MQRLALVRQHFPDVEQRVRDLKWSVSGNLDDPLDAYAALWTAGRVAEHGFKGAEVIERLATESGVLDVPRDNNGAGLLMRMVV